MINFCHIWPTAFLKQHASAQTHHLVLAHLVEEDSEYAAFYRDLPADSVKILDNSAFEMYKRGQPMYPSAKLVDMGTRIGADYIVMSDYPGEHPDKTIDAAKQLIPVFKDAGFKTFFVPQSEIGQTDQLMDAFEWGLSRTDVDLIGMSILGCPNALGIQSNNTLQRYMSRYHIFRMLHQRGLLVDNMFHCLGMNDGPNEIELLKDFHQYIYSWDSSAAVWAGINNIKFDNSPTGLIDGKFELEVDFGLSRPLNGQQLDYIKYNTTQIDKMSKGDYTI